MSLIKMLHVVKNYKLQNTNYKQITNHKLQITNKVAHELPRIGATSNQKLLRGGLNQWVSGSVCQLVSSMIGKRSYESLIMMPRPHPETNENPHKRFAQHIGSPRRGAPGRRRQKK